MSDHQSNMPPYEADTYASASANILMGQDKRRDFGKAIGRAFVATAVGGGLLGAFGAAIVVGIAAIIPQVSIGFSAIAYTAGASALLGGVAGASMVAGWRGGVLTGHLQGRDFGIQAAKEGDVKAPSLEQQPEQQPALDAPTRRQDHSAKLLEQRAAELTVAASR